ncbi:MAG: ferredoxin family protein [Ignavibacteriae bacterium]|nr:ferredoxin family protein [Ignavibacteria bacterium]MBI3364913.1 ferredoxin family protein [Ignavibacteriota bacterium]
MTYIVCEPCFDCKFTDCVEVCPVDCFYEDEHMLYIHADECIDCGACIPECPVEAIFAEADVPEQWNEWIPINKDRAPVSAQITHKKDSLVGTTAKECKKK